MDEEVPSSKDETDGYIGSLEAKKADILEKIKKLNGRIRYKEYEMNALEPFLEQTKDIRIGPLRKQLRQLEFRIATEAYTAKIERELVKEVKRVEAELSKVSEVERARRKKSLVEMDIEEAKREIAKIEPELKKIRDELNEHYDSLRVAKRVEKKGIKNDHMVSLEEIVVFENGEE